MHYIPYIIPIPWVIFEVIKVGCIFKIYYITFGASKLAPFLLEASTLFSNKFIGDTKLIVISIFC